MDWIKFPIDEILLAGRTDAQTFAIIKYVALYCQLEKEPTERQLLRVLTRRELKFVSTLVGLWSDFASTLVSNVVSKRGRNKSDYSKKINKTKVKNEIQHSESLLSENFQSEQIRIDKNREEKYIFSASADAAHEKAEASYRTKKKRTLSGKRLESFERFWAAFGYAKGKAEAADAWLDIPSLTNALVNTICLAAEREAARRPEIVARGNTPKMAQGWISGRRWEDVPESEEKEVGILEYLAQRERETREAVAQ
jgi:hypothetical protein